VEAENAAMNVDSLFVVCCSLLSSTFSVDLTSEDRSVGCFFIILFQCFIMLVFSLVKDKNC